MESTNFINITFGSENAEDTPEYRDRQLELAMDSMLHEDDCMVMFGNTATSYLEATYNILPKYTGKEEGPFEEMFGVEHKGHRFIFTRFSEFDVEAECDIGATSLLLKDIDNKYTSLFVFRKGDNFFEKLTRIAVLD